MPDRPKTHQRLTTENAALKERIRELEAMQGLPGRFLQVNDEACRRLGYTREELLTLTPRDITIPEEYERIAGKRIGLASGASILMETIHLTKDGRKIPVEGNIRRFQYFGMQAALSISRDLTEHKLAEKTLRESEALQRALLASLPAGVIIIDPATRMIESVNDTAAAMFGVQAELIVGHRCHSFLCPASEDACPVCDLGKEVDNAEREMICSDGSRRPVLKSVKRIQMRSQEKLLECFVDIAPQKLTEEALRKSEEKYRLIAENSKDVIWTMGLDGRFTYVSPSVTMHAGYSPEEAMAMTLETYMYKEDLPWVMEEIAREMQKPREQRSDGRTLEVRQYKKDGSVLDVEVSVAWLYNERGETVGLQGSTRDISARKRAEEALRESEEKYRALFENSAVAIGMRSPDGRYIEFNRTYAEMLGYTRDELLSMTTADITHPEDVEISRSNMSSVAEGRAEIRRYQKRYLHKSGAIVWGDVCIRPLPDRDGKVAAIIGAIVDITDIKRAEEALRIFMESVENSSDAVGMSTPEGKHYYQNKVFDELFGSIGENPPETLYVDRAVGYEVFSTIMAGGKWTGEVKMYAKDRKILTIYLRAYANKDENGRITGLVGVHTDITERKRTEERIAHLAAMVDLAPSAITVHDFAGRFLYTNEKNLEIHGYSREELMALNLCDIDVPSSAALIKERMNLILDGGEASFNVEHYCKDGTTVPLEVFVKLVDWYGKPVLLSIGKDMREGNRAEEEREKLQAQLTRAQKLESIGTLAGGIAHDFSPSARWPGASPMISTICSWGFRGMPP